MIGSVTFGGLIVVVSIEVVVVLLISLKLDSTMGLVIVVVVSMANVVGIVVTISLGSVADSCGKSVFSGFAGLAEYAVPSIDSAFGGGSLTRDISILTPPSTVLNIV